MDHSSQDAAAFIRKLTELAYRLASRDIVVSSLHADWSSFGCWQLEAQRGAETDSYGKAILSSLDPKHALGPEVIRVLWDGRDGVLSVEAASPTRFLCGPVEWKPECNKEFGLTDGGLFQFVEDYLIKRLGA
jgi:hypothetical protein